jgi:2-octaprenylphenol hydroxylase
MTTASPQHAQVAVVGGGMVGACLAALLVRQTSLASESVLLFAPEASATDAAGSQDRAAPDARVVAVSRASERILRRAGAWEHLPAARVCAYERMRVWHESTTVAGALRFDAADVAEPNLGYIVENRELQRSCLAAFQAAGGRVITEPVQMLRAGPDRVRIETGTAAYAVQLAVGADGARSLVRAQAGIDATVHDYRQFAIVAVVATAKPHEATAWQRFLATGPLAFLPLFDGSSSIVWSVQEALAPELMDCTPTEFNRRLDRASDLALGETALRGERACFPLRSLAASSYVARRVALIGDAAHSVHPLAGQGANLGLLDAASLCDAVGQALSEREDVGALRVLRTYERERRTHNTLMSAAMDVFHAGFGAARGPAAWLAGQALGAVNRSGLARRLFAGYALGTRGELPRLAR